MRYLVNCYKNIISEENLWNAWILFRQGKRKRFDVREFEFDLENKLLSLQKELSLGIYQHGAYRSFVVHDSKRRVISAPNVRDQIVHQAMWNILFPFFNRRFYSGVFSCRPGYGVHSAVRQVQKIAKHFGTCSKIFLLHLDIIKFFDSVSHAKLFHILRQWIQCGKTLSLLSVILSSFSVSQKEKPTGIPLGNLTSQLFCNIILMPLDQMIRGSLLSERYVRYADDIFILGTSKQELVQIGQILEKYLLSFQFQSRWSVKHYHGFEGLGKRFFLESIGMRRNTRIRAEKKWKYSIKLWSKNFLSCAELGQKFSSFQAISMPFFEKRWKQKLTKEFLSYAF